ncbi:MAG: shikimate dehydrogenase [Clostridia bacterium]|nr:shikimate dehydrogenase [Clostridia bacterium]
MYKLGLLGSGISYTLSPLVHGAAFDYLGVEGAYDVFDTSNEKLEETVRRMRESLDGFNVTKPYKEMIIPLIDEDKSGCGAVNTVAMTGGKAVGYNTDGSGFLRSFNEDCDLTFGENVLVLGAGGAAKVVVKTLKDAGFAVYAHNRTADRLKPLLQETGAREWRGESAAAIINCTSCGLKNGDNPLSSLVEKFDKKSVKYAYDLIYSPPETDFLKEMRAAGARTKNGLDMLVYQAVKADEIILGVNLTDADYREIKRLVMRIVGK